MPGCPPCTAWPGATPPWWWSTVGRSGAALSRPEVLRGAPTWPLGPRYDVQDLCRRRLTAAGYTRTIRWRAPVSLPCGAASWTCSPRAWSSRCAANFSTTRSTPGRILTTATPAPELNRREALLLPAARSCCRRRDHRRGRRRRRAHGGCRPPPEEGRRRPIRQRLLDDAELLRQGIAPPGAWTAIWPPSARTRPPRFDYLARGRGGRCAATAAVDETLPGPFCSSRTSGCGPPEWRRLLAGEPALPPRSREPGRMGTHPLVLLDSLPTRRASAAAGPCCWTSAPSNSPPTAAALMPPPADITHYLAAGIGVLVLCGNETRAEKPPADPGGPGHPRAALDLENDPPRPGTRRHRPWGAVRRQ